MNHEIDPYLNAIRRLPLMERGEEQELAGRYRCTGDPALARRLAGAHLRLVVKIARQYRWAHASLADLVAEGNVGLMRSIDHYDERRGVRLSSYATWWIRAMILRFIVDNWRVVRVGTTSDQRKVMFRLSRTRARLEQRLGTAPDAQQLAGALGVGEKTVVALQTFLDLPEVRLDAPQARELSLAADRRPDRMVEEMELRRELSRAVRGFAAGLEARDRQLFTWRWLGEVQLTLQEVGDRLGVTRERVRQLESRLLRRLRAHLQHTLGDGAEMPELAAA